MADRQQMQNSMATVGAMVDGAAAVMQRLHPEMKVRSWNELTDGEQQAMTAALHSMLAPLATILTGTPGGPKVVLPGGS